MSTLAEVEAAVNRIQRKYDYTVDDEGNGNFRVTLSDGDKSSDVVVSPGEDMDAEIMRLVKDVDEHKYDTED